MSKSSDQDMSITITLPYYDLKKLRKARELQKQINVISDKAEGRIKTQEEKDELHRLYKEQEVFLSALGLNVMYDAPENI